MLYDDSVESQQLPEIKKKTPSDCPGLL